MSVQLPVHFHLLNMRQAKPVNANSATKLMHSWGFALREGVFAETKERKCKNKREKS